MTAVGGGVGLAVGGVMTIGVAVGMAEGVAEGVAADKRVAVARAVSLARPVMAFCTVVAGAVSGVSVERGIGELVADAAGGFRATAVVPAPIAGSVSASKPERTTPTTTNSSTSSPMRPTILQRDFCAPGSAGGGNW